MKVLITGAGGQLGRAVIRAAPSDVTLVALDHRQLDVADSRAVHTCVHSLRPDVILNAAAYTNVDRAEVEKDAARRVNTDGPRALAAAAKRGTTRLIHISTNFVFDGCSSVPYHPASVTNPLNVYGTTKRDGECAALDLLPERTVVLRTAWLYSADGSNFVKTILRALQENALARVVVDQVGTPTSAESLANALWNIVGTPDLNGIHHWTDAGATSWYDFAVAVAEEAVSLNKLAPGWVVLPIASREYGSPAARPQYSVLNCQSLTSKGITPAHWRANLRIVLARIATSSRPIVRE